MTEFDVFDILGIGSREDSYTDLLAVAFQVPQMKDAILRSFGEENHIAWKLKTRYPVQISKPGGRKKDVPDMVFFNPELRKTIIVENKVFSGEGWEQTKHYSSNEFRERLEKRLGFPIEDYKFFYLTLDGTPPSSEDFTPIKFYEIIETMPDKIDHHRFDMLLEDFRERIRRYEQWESPSSDSIVIDYLNRTDGFVNYRRTMTKLCEGLLDSNEFERWTFETQNPGYGSIPLSLWRKPHWISEHADKVSGDRCFNIHFEFQWTMKEDDKKLKYYLHYEMNPYQPRKKISQNQEFIDKFITQRDSFYEHLKTSGIREWKLHKHWLQMASYDFDLEIRYGRLKNEIRSLSSQMSEVVDNYLM